MPTLLEKAKRTLADAEARLNEALDAVESASDETSAEDLEALNTALDESEQDVVRARADHDRLERIYKARDESRVIVIDPEEKPGRTSSGMTAYSKTGRHSFFRDIHMSKRGDRDAIKRLSQNAEEVREEYGDEYEQRDVDSSAGSGAGFLPPIWLAEEWASKARPGRKFANAVPSMTMPPAGEVLTIPKVTGGTDVDVQAAEGDSVAETDLETDNVTAPLVTIAGQQNIKRQTLERSYPGLDEVIFDDLRRAYDARLDKQTIAGTGLNGQHQGIRVAAGATAVSFTGSTQEALLAKVYNAISNVATERFEEPDMIVMHPRRAAWLAAGRAQDVPIFQQGGLVLSQGQQDAGFVGVFAGLPVLTDANVPTNLGSGTNEDEIYVLYSADLRLAEDDIRQFTFEEVLSGTLTVRLQLFAYSFFVPDRYPEGICVVSGSGLATPSFS